MFYYCQIYLDNIYKGKITNFKKFNTLIIDGEGIEDHYIKNLKFANNIKYIYFGMTRIVILIYLRK